MPPWGKSTTVWVIEVEKKPGEWVPLNLNQFVRSEDGLRFAESGVFSDPETAEILLNNIYHLLSPNHDYQVTAYDLRRCKP